MVEEEIWIIDSDKDDRELIKEIVLELELPNKVQFFDTTKDFMNHLEEAPTAPFIILCEVNPVDGDGFKLREKLLAEPKKKFHSVPFIFWSTAASEQQIDRAYKLRAHGFFIKEASFRQWKETLVTIINYWRHSKMPSKVDAADASLI
jgi:DNA-binding NtrC family response regulator